LRREGQRLTWCEADPEGETFDVARLLHSGQPAGSQIMLTFSSLLGILLIVTSLDFFS